MLVSEVELRGVSESVNCVVEKGKVERISEILFKKKWFKESARVDGSSCEGKERLFLL